MKVNKWHFDTRKYEVVNVEDDFRTYNRNMDEIIKCINCKRPVQYGNTYSSLRYHDGVGFAYPVCPDCYEEEWKEQTKYKKKK